MSQVPIIFENLITHRATTRMLSRVPCVNELIVLCIDSPEEETFEVKEVIHIADISDEDQPVAIVRAR